MAERSRTGDSAISDLRRRYDDLTSSQKRIAELIVDDAEFVSFATVDKFAARLGVSPSTIVRFAYRLGLAGYPELQDEVRRKLMNGLRQAGGEPDGGGPASHLGVSVAATSLHHDMDILSKTAARTNLADVKQAVEILARAPRVRVVGGMTAFSIAHYAAITLDRVREDVVALTGSPVPAGPLLALEPGDAVLAFAFPPYTKSTVDVIAAAKARGASIVAVTDSPVSPLRGAADVLLPVVVSGIGMQNSLVGAMALANVIANAVTAEVPGALERCSGTLDLLSSWDTYLLGSHQDG